MTRIIAYHKKKAVMVQINTLQGDVKVLIMDVQTGSNNDDCF